MSQISDGAAVVGTSERYPLGGAVLHEYLSHELKSRSMCLSKDNVQRLKEMCAEVADSQESYSELLAERKAPSNGISAPAEGAGEEAAPEAATASAPAGGPTKHVLPDGQEVTLEGEGCATVVFLVPDLHRR